MKQLVAEIPVQKRMTLGLTPEEVQALFNILGDLPTKTGVYPLMMKIKEQAEAQMNAQENSNG